MSLAWEPHLEEDFLDVEKLHLKASGCQVSSDRGAGDDSGCFHNQKREHPDWETTQD